MKTPEEIVDWLKSHEWYPSYVLNTNLSLTANNHEDEIGKFIRGEKGIHTIDGAFLWSKYPYGKYDGVTFWSKVHKEFLEWFKN